MEFTGRLTADAVINNAKNDKRVVNFTIAINDSFKRNGAWEKKTTFIRCAYWLGTGIATYLRKGDLVEVAGHLSQDVYLDKQGQPKASINFHVNNIKLHGGTHRQAASLSAAPAVAAQKADDLPF